MTVLGWLLLLAAPQEDHPLNTWVKRTPVEATPVSPRLGYEGDCVWYARQGVLLRYGGHNQGGGGEQGSEVWILDPRSWAWTLKEPNTSPPGVCCVQQNIYDPARGVYLRFPSFSGGHGWQWHREIYLNNTSVWAYELETNLWKNRRPLPAPPIAPLRCASWDSDHEVVVIFGGEGSREGTLVYDPHANTWHRMKPARQPEFRSGGQMCYDEARRLHVLFGAQFSRDDATWVYDLRKNEWSARRPDPLPPADRNDAVLAYDSVNRVVLAIVKVTEGKDEDARHRLETWAYDAGADRWTKMNPAREPDPSGNRARDLMFVPEHNLFYLENCPGRPREQQVWTYRYAAGRPPEPMSLRLRTRKDGAELVFQGPPGKHAVFRGEGPRPWEAEFREVGVCEAGAPFVDSGLQPGTLYHYRVGRARGRTQPALVEDVVVSVLSREEVEVSWKPPPGDPAVGYHVERAAVEVYSEDQLKRLKSRTPPLEPPSVGAIRKVGPFRRLTEAPLGGTSFTDRVNLEAPPKIDGDPVFDAPLNSEQLDPAGRPCRFAVYAYRVRAVNALGVEGGPSPAVFTLPSAPQWLFSREDGASGHLKWAANPEKAIRGYRVYRMDGRWDKDTVSRLTPEPIARTSFRDPEAAGKTRRYYVVAVDAIGQEGHPSAPVWYEREWKKYYEPFVGEWHQ
jgi:hypothetical protein